MTHMVAQSLKSSSASSLPGGSKTFGRTKNIWEDQRHLGGPKKLIAEEAEGTKLMPEDMLAASFIE